MDQKIIILIIIIFILTTPIQNIIINIITYGFYFIIILSIIGFINPNISKTIKNYTISFINFDSSIISNVAQYIKKILLGDYDLTIKHKHTIKEMD
jgi:hypothetical protein